MLHVYSMPKFTVIITVTVSITDDIYVDYLKVLHYHSCYIHGQTHLLSCNTLSLLLYTISKDAITPLHHCWQCTSLTDAHVHVARKS